MLVFHHFNIIRSCITWWFSVCRHVTSLNGCTLWLLQVNDKTGGYNNKLVITCLRSGLNRSFRVLQKPERAPIRALRASSSGRSATCFSTMDLYQYYTTTFVCFLKHNILFQVPSDSVPRCSCWSVGYDKEPHDGTTSFAFIYAIMERNGCWQLRWKILWTCISKKKQSLMLPHWLLQWAIGCAKLCSSRWQWESELV